MDTRTAPTTATAQLALARTRKPMSDRALMFIFGIITIIGLVGFAWAGSQLPPSPKPPPCTAVSAYSSAPCTPAN